MSAKLPPEEKKKRKAVCTRRWYFKNRDRLLKKAAQYRKKNRSKILKWLAGYRGRNRKKLCRDSVAYTREQRKTNPMRRMKDSLRASLRSALMRIGVRKTKATFKLTGCSPIELRAHLEALFKPGMTWSNYGRFGWHIDHIKPCAAFNLRKKSEQKKCFHYANLKPSWWQDNQKKTSFWRGHMYRFKDHAA